MKDVLLSSAAAIPCAAQTVADAVRAVFRAHDHAGDSRKTAGIRRQPSRVVCGGKEAVAK